MPATHLLGPQMGAVSAMHFTHSRVIAGATKHCFPDLEHLLQDIFATRQLRWWKDFNAKWWDLFNGSRLSTQKGDAEGMFDSDYGQRSADHFSVVGGVVYRIRRR